MRSVTCMPSSLGLFSPDNGASERSLLTFWRGEWGRSLVAGIWRAAAFQRVLTYCNSHSYLQGRLGLLRQRWNPTVRGVFDRRRPLTGPVDSEQIKWATPGWPLQLNVRMENGSCRSGLRSNPGHASLRYHHRHASVSIGMITPFLKNDVQSRYLLKLRASA